jgi:NAD-dependent oxidoreductase involved in siderophore biosynthesis
MRPRKSEPQQPSVEPAAGFDPALDAALKRVLEVIYKEHPLEPNQILTLASELQRLGIHRLVEEHLRKFRRQEAAKD